jgi:hypothetical protein
MKATLRCGAEPRCSGDRRRQPDHRRHRDDDRAQQRRAHVLHQPGGAGQAAKRKRGLLIALAVSFGGLGLAIAGIAGEVVALIVAGVVAFIAGLVVIAANGALFRITKIDADFIRLKVKPEFWSGLGPMQSPASHV